MGKRRRSRILALQVMYQSDAGKRSPDDILPTFWDAQESLQADERHFAEDLVGGLMEHRGKIDALIERYSEHWAPERMAVIDRNILRLAIYEILYRSDIPPKVTINEYVDVAKRFSTEDSGAFVNGLLDRIYQDYREEAASDRAEG